MTATPSRTNSPIQRRFAPAFDPLERRRLFSIAPIAFDDVYFIGPDGRLSVDVGPTPIPSTFDGTIAPAPRPPGQYDTHDFDLTVTGGQVVNSPDAVQAGFAPNAQSAILVADPGSLWRIGSHLEAGDRGRADIELRGGGKLSVHDWFELGQNGEGNLLIRDGGILETQNWTSVAAAEESAGGLPRGVATVTVTGAGSHWTGANFVQVGANGGMGTVKIADHAVVNLQNWTSFGFGRGGDGILDLSGGGRLVQADFAGIGERNSDGGALVQGAGTLWQVGNHLTVGDTGGNGGLIVAAGATVNQANFANIGINGAYGTASVMGHQSRWNIGGSLDVGDDGGFGVLTIADGAVVTNQGTGYIGLNPNSSGRVIVDGSGSKWVSRGSQLRIGGGFGARFGRGALIVRDGGQVESGDILVFPGGSVLGSGVVHAPNLFNSGVIDPGESDADAIGLLTLQGRLVESTDPDHPGVDPGTLRFDLAGRGRGEKYDALDVDSSVRLDGKLVLNFINNFAPGAGDRFRLIDAKSINGDFKSVEVRGLAAGFQYHLTTSNGALTLVVDSDGHAAPIVVPPGAGRGVLANDVDKDGDPLFAVLDDRPHHGAVTLYGDGSFTYVADATFAGEDTFQYRVDDGTSSGNVATVTIRRRPSATPDLLISSSAWIDGFRAAIAQGGLGDGGFSVPNGPHGDTPLPWSNLNQVKLHFGQDVTVQAGDLTIHGSHGLGAPAFAYDAGSQTATWTFPHALSADRLTFHYGDTTWHATILPGDADAGGKVDAADLVLVRKKLGQTLAPRPKSVSSYSVYADFNGDGAINAADLVTARNGVGSSLPSLFSATFIEPLLSRRREGDDESLV